MSKLATLLTPQQLADETGIPVQSLYEYFAPKGDLPVVRRTLGSKSAKRRTRGRILVQRSAWEAWLERHTTAPTPPPKPAPRPVSVLDLPGSDRYLQ